MAHRLRPRRGRRLPAAGDGGSSSGNRSSSRPRLRCAGLAAALVLFLLLAAATATSAAAAAAAEAGGAGSARAPSGGPRLTSGEKSVAAPQQQRRWRHRGRRRQRPAFSRGVEEEEDADDDDGQEEGETGDVVDAGSRDVEEQDDAAAAAAGAAADEVDGGDEEEEEEEELMRLMVRQGGVWEDPAGLTVLRRLGSGKFSEVFEAWQEGLAGGSSASFPSRKVVLKVLRPVPNWRVEREVRILRWLQRGPNIIRLWGRTKTSRHALLLEYISPEARPLDHGEDGLSDFEVRYFVYELLRALAWTHARGVMHRDVKNKNVLIDRHTRTLRLVDWGSADAHVPGQANNVFVATRYFKAPELLLHHPHYDYSVDVWGVGCILAGLLFKREPFFRGVDDRDQLKRIASVLGTDDLFACCERYGIALDKELRALLGRRPRAAWSRYIHEGNKHLCTLDGLDLLDQLLRYDHRQRISAADALAHDYFEPIRRLQEKATEAEMKRRHPFLRTEKDDEQRRRRRHNKDKAGRLLSAQLERPPGSLGKDGRIAGSSSGRQPSSSPFLSPRAAASVS